MRLGSIQGNACPTSSPRPTPRKITPLIKKLATNRPVANCHSLRGEVNSNPSMLAAKSLVARSAKMPATTSARGMPAI